MILRVQPAIKRISPAEFDRLKAELEKRNPISVMYPKDPTRGSFWYRFGIENSTVVFKAQPHSSFQDRLVSVMLETRAPFFGTEHEQAAWFRAFPDKHHTILADGTLQAGLTVDTIDVPTIIRNALVIDANLDPTKNAVTTSPDIGVFGLERCNLEPRILLERLVIGTMNRVADKIHDLPDIIRLLARMREVDPRTLEITQERIIDKRIYWEKGKPIAVLKDDVLEIK